MKKVTTEYYCDGCGNEIERGKPCITLNGKQSPDNMRTQMSFAQMLDVPGSTQISFSFPSYEVHFCCVKCFTSWFIRTAQKNGVDMEHFCRCGDAPTPSQIIEVQ